KENAIAYQLQAVQEEKKKLDSPDPAVAKRQRRVEFMPTPSPCSTGTNNRSQAVQFVPEVDFSYFTKFLFVPCLVFEMDYPTMGHKFRPGYFFHKLWDLAAVIVS